VAVFVPRSGTEALVADFQTSSVTPVTLPALTPRTPIPLGANPTGIDSSPGSPVAWVSAGFGVTPLSLPGGTVGTPIPLGVASQCIAVTRDDRAWVCSGSGALVEVDLTSGKTVRTVGLDGIPAAVVVSGTAAA